MSRGSVPQSPDDLKEHLQEQIEFLRRSTDSYDDGFEAEAKRLALTLRVLLHDTPNSHSLLAQLGLKSRNFLSTSIPRQEENLLSHWGLLTLEMNRSGKGYLPPLDDCRTYRWLSFDDWWAEIVFEDADKNEMSRRDVILAVANKDGGAHVDPELTEVYANLSRKNSLGWRRVTESGESQPIPHPERAAIRQIAHEVLKTLIPGYAKDLPRDKTSVMTGLTLVKGTEVPEIPDPDPVGRNDPCPCGSGDKYKVCHGRPY